MILECFASYNGFIFYELLIVFTDGNHKYNGCHVFKAMDPLFSLTSLATHIKHAIGQISNDKGCLNDSRRLDTRSQNILVIRNVSWSSHTVQGIKVAKFGV